MARRMNWSHAKIERIREYAGKKTVGEIASMFGCSVDSLRMVAKRNGISLRYSGAEIHVCPMCGARVTHITYSGVCKACRRDWRDEQKQVYSKTLENGLRRYKAHKAEIERIARGEREAIEAKGDASHVIDQRNLRLREQLPKGHPLKKPLCGNYETTQIDDPSPIQIYDAPGFDLDKIAESGQAFRWRMLGPLEYAIPAFGEVVIARQDGDVLVVDGTYQHDLWAHYFALDEDYSAIEERIEASGLEWLDAVTCGHGLRVLNQDAWEVAVTFVISQNNNIPRIKKCIERICRENSDGWAFPSPQALKSFPDVGLGYRHAYVESLAESWDAGLGKWLAEGHSLAEDMERLQQCSGISHKVAACICLFGLGHVDALPVDTWTNQAMERGIDFADVEGIEGIAQQYVYYWIRNYMEG